MIRGHSVPLPIRLSEALAIGRGLVATNARWLDLDLRLTKDGHLPRAEPPLARRIDPLRQPRTECRQEFTRWLAASRPFMSMGRGSSFA